MPQNDNWVRVGEAIERRRLELGLTQDEAVDRSGGLISLAVWSIIENARQQKYRTRTLVGVAKALNWPNDAIERLLAGEDPADFPRSVRWDPPASTSRVPAWNVSARDSAAGTDRAHVEQLPQWGAGLRSEVAELAERLGLVQAAVDQLIAERDPGGEVVPFRRAAKEPGATETGPRSDRPGNEAPEGQEEPP